jgi:hypothetical protein
MTSFIERFKIDPAELKRISVIAMIITNLVPLYGVLFMGWQVFPVMLLFWIENVIIGVSNVAKMLVSSPSNAWQWVAKIFMIPFFCVHYGMFTLVHGIFVIVFFGGYAHQGAAMPSFSDVFNLIGTLQIGGAVLALILSHTISFVTNYIGKGEYKTANLAELMAQPYGRVMILHFTILIGGFLVMTLGSPVIGLVLLIGIKIFVDIGAHVKQHKTVSVPKKVMGVVEG